MCRGSLGFRDGEGPTVPLPCKPCSARGTVRIHYSCLVETVKREPRGVFNPRWEKAYSSFHYTCPICSDVRVLTTEYRRVDREWRGARKALRRTCKRLCRQIKIENISDVFWMLLFYAAALGPVLLAWAERWLYPLDDGSVPCIVATAALAPLELLLLGSASAACGDDRTLQFCALAAALRVIRLFAFRRLLPLTGWAGFAVRESFWAVVVVGCVVGVSMLELGAKLSERKRYWAITSVASENQ